MTFQYVCGPQALIIAAGWSRWTLPLVLLAVVALLSGTSSTAHGQVDSNQEPEFAEDAVNRTLPENSGAGVDIGLPIATTDADNDPLIYELSGAEAAAFGVGVSTGQLRTTASLNYEQKAVYTFTLTVRDGKDATGQTDTAVDDTVDITVVVANVDEPGTLSILSTKPRVGDVLRARLVDTDGLASSVAWNWFRSTDKSDWTDLGNPGDTYMPVAKDEGMYLRITASYDDPAGGGKSLEYSTADTVGERQLLKGLDVVELVTGLSIPWGLAFAPDGTLLFTERSGTLRARLTDGTVVAVNADLSDLYVAGHVGLLGIVVDPSFNSNRRFYTCQAHVDPREMQVIAWTIADDYSNATRVNDPLVGGIYSTNFNGGCRLRFGPDGHLWIAVGDAHQGERPDVSVAQDLTSLAGKVLRVVPTNGEGAPGNPFASAPLVYTYGHRNIQGLALRPDTRQMWSIEHGPHRDDEINLLTAGANHGWNPGWVFDERVPMTDIGKYPDAVQSKWSSGESAIAPSGGVFLEGDEWGALKGQLAVAFLRDRNLRFFEFSSDGTLLSEVVAWDLDEIDALYGRLRTPMMGPDGSLYITTSNGPNIDMILKVTPTDAPTFLEGDYTTRQVPSSAQPAYEIGQPVQAMDVNADVLTYSLSSGDYAHMFDIDAETGQLRTGPSFIHINQEYFIHVSVHDSVNAEGDADTAIDDTIGVTITATDECTSAVAPPCAPGTPNLSSASDTSLRVAWTASRTPSGTSITGYELQYRESDSGGNWIPESVTGTDRTHTIENLVKDTAYEVRVRAMNDGNGYGGWSQSGTGRPGYVPPPPPPSITTDTGGDGGGSGGGGGGGRGGRAPANQEPKFVDGGSTTRDAPEDTHSGGGLGDPVNATDDDDDTLTYSLRGDDADSFTIDEETGQLYAEVPLDYETRASYGLEVRVTDGEGGDDTITVTITVTDVNEPPLISGPDATEYEENGEDAVAAYTATDPEGGEVVAWTLAGDDAELFTVSNGGVLAFNDSPDFEAPGDTDEDNVYAVTVQASDGTGTASLDVATTVTDLDLDSPYDADGNEVIDKDEAISAAVDYFAGLIDKDEVISVIVLYFRG